MKTMKQILTLSLLMKLGAIGAVTLQSPSAYAVTKKVKRQTKVQKTSHQMTVQEVEGLLKTRLKGIPPVVIRPLAQHLFNVCAHHGFKPDFVLSLIEAESGFKVNAESKVGALGLMQLMPATAQYISIKFKVHTYQDADDLKNPFVNISLGVIYLSYLRTKFVSKDRILAAYNMGPNKLKRRSKMNIDHPALVNRYIQDIQKNEKTMKQKAQDTIVASL